MNENAGHRERLDKRVIEQDFESLKEHEQLEHLLFAVIPRGDTNKIAHRLLEEYGSIAGVFNANPEELMKIDGVGRRTAMFLASLPHLLGIVEQNIKKQKPIVLKSTIDKVEFARTYFYGKAIENAYIVSMSADYRFKHITRLARGVGKENESVLFVTEAVRQALSDGASVVFIVHNHPFSEVKPSAADIELSRKLYYAFEGMDIDFDDSLIISGENYFSMKDMGYLDPAFLESERTQRMKERMKKTK